MLQHHSKLRKGVSVAEKATGARWRKRRVRELMTKAGYKTLGQLANDIDVSRQTVTMAINGGTQPTLALTLAVAHALGVPVEEIAERAPDLKFPKGKGRSSGQLRATTVAQNLTYSL